MAKTVCKIGPKNNICQPQTRSHSKLIFLLSYKRGLFTLLQSYLPSYLPEYAVQSKFNWDSYCKEVQEPDFIFASILIYFYRTSCLKPDGWESSFCYILSFS